MSSPLKQLLLKIVRLPFADQRWILRQLSQKQLQTFERCQGGALLTAAKRFRNVKTEAQALPVAPPKLLPDYCQQLANKTPLYTAIILEQGSYPWQTLFLQQCDRDNSIKTSLENHVPDIKLPVKQALFSEWQNTLSFEEQLGNSHG